MRRFKLFALAVLLVAPASFAQWTTDTTTSDIYSAMNMSSHAVSVGGYHPNLPGLLLDVRSDVRPVIGISTENSSSTQNPELRFFTFHALQAHLGVAQVTNGGVTGSVLGDEYMMTEGGSILFSVNHGSSMAALINRSGDFLVPTGRIGIGTTNVTDRLTVAGAIHSTSGGFIYPDGTTQSSASTYSSDTLSLFAVNTNASCNLCNPSTVYSISNNAKAYVGIMGSTPNLPIPGMSGGDMYIRTQNQKLFLSTDGGVSSALTFETNGDATFKGTVRGGNIIAKYQDVAEWVPSGKQLRAGTVVIINAAKKNEVMPSSHAYDTAVAGVVSQQPGVLLGEASDTKSIIATTGRVKVHVDATRHPISVGDLLVTSDKNGVAMASEPIDVGGVKIHRPGTLIGKALEPLPAGEGDILVLLSLQ